MRLFVAIEIPPSIKQRLHDFLQPRLSLATLSWSPVDNLHITTKFIGEWPEARLEEMKQTLAELPVDSPIEISVDGIGWFPNQDSNQHSNKPRPRVLYAGVNASASLRALARATDNATASLGVPLDAREYMPHLTLARIRKAIPLEALRHSLTTGATDFGSFHATQFFLYLSAGGIYTQLAEFPLP